MAFLNAVRLFARGRLKTGVSFLLILGLATLGAFALSGKLEAHDTDPVAHWSLNEGSGTTANDVSGHGNNGTLLNGTAWGAGVIGSNSLSFDGLNDYVDAGNGATLNPADQITVAAWVRVPANPTTTQMILSKYLGANAQYFLRIQSNRKFRFHFTADGVLSGPADSATLITANTWYHVVGTYDGATAKLYVNGVLQSSLAKTGFMSDIGAPVNLGRQPGGMYFKGLMDDVRIYNRALSDVEIGELYDTVPPTASMTAPTAGATVYGITAVSANASDNKAVSDVQFLLDGADLGFEDSTAPYSINWDTVTASDGVHTLSARVHDVAGNTFTSSQISVTVDNSVPKLVLLIPTEGSTVNGTTIDVTYTTTGNLAAAGVDHVHFVLDNSPQHKMDIPMDGFYQFTNVAPGAHVLTGYLVTSGHVKIPGTDAIPVNFTNVLPPPDTTPPTAALTSPTAGSVVSGSVSVAANASDNIAVAGVQFVLDGGSLGAEDTTAPYVINWNSALVSDGIHVLEAVARDTSGNVATSSPISVTVNNAPQPQGFAAHWPFNEGSGTVANDVSGNGNHGTIVNGPTWVTGIVGTNALSFDGVNDYVDAGNSATLNPANAISISTWIRVPSLPTSNQMIVSKYSDTDLQYFIRLQSSRKFRFNLTTNGVLGGPADSTTLITANTWYHVVGTYDGATAKLYVNGVLQSSAPKTGTFTNNGMNLNIARQTNGMYFKGMLDDVRIYNRALSATEISTLYANSPDPSQIGEWSPVMNWPLVAVHSVLMPNGKLLLWDEEHGTTGTSGGLSARVWDPATNTFTDVPNTFSNIFCAGQAQMPDGRILVAGGHISDNVGIRDLNIFDPATNTWTAGPQMSQPRWYPTVTALPDGRMLITAGSTNCPTCNALIPEIYDPVTNTVTDLTNASQDIPTYPFMFSLKNGKVLNAGESTFPTKTLDILLQSWATVDPILRSANSAVMYLPNKLMKAGLSTYTLDMDAPSPVWQTGSAMNVPRKNFANLTILPDGNVVAIGGTNSANTPAFDAEMWNATTQSWTKWAAMQVPRLYHSTSLLLPDGKVLSAGGGRAGNDIDYLDAQIFSPPYLFKGPRPTITSVPTTLTYNSAFTVSTPNAASISKVTLVRLGATTHAFDQNQRFANLSFQQNGNDLTVQAPLDGGIAPPGYYMLFIVDNVGVPSLASFVRI